VGAGGEPPRGIRTMGEAPRKLTLERILLYSLASAGLNIMSITVSTWILYFYAPPPDSGRIQYLPAALVGILLTVGSLWDAVIDPSWLCLFCRANLATYSPKGRPGRRRRPSGSARGSGRWRAASVSASKTPTAETDSEGLGSRQGRKVRAWRRSRVRQHA
jgi:hypothetical protein